MASCKTYYISGLNHLKLVVVNDSPMKFVSMRFTQVKFLNQNVLKNKSGKLPLMTVPIKDE